MVSTTEGFINNSPISPMISTPLKKTSARISLCMLINILEVKKLLTVELELLNLSVRQLNLEINYGYWNKSEEGIHKFMNR